MTTPTVTSAQQAAELVLEQVIKASRQGTFAVGGILIENKTGKVIHTAHNRVVSQLRSGDAFPLNPTNHGERQIVSWYYANRDRLNLPHPSELTVVTSLDPCAMCAGCLTTAGFNVAVVAPDDYAGVNWNNQVDFANTPPTIHQKLSNLFGYYKVENGPTYRSTYKGGDNVLFKDQAISDSIYQQNLNRFTETAEQVRLSISGSGLQPSQLKNPLALSPDSQTRQELEKLYSKSLSVVLTERQENSQYYQPNQKLYQLLKQLRDSTPGAKNAVALIDPFRNLLLASADRFDISPVATAFMNVVQQYAELRFQLADSSSLDPGGYQNSESYQTLTNPSYCTFVFLNNLDFDATTTLKDFGVYGSTMEGAVPAGNFVYIDPSKQGTSSQLDQQIQSLPPLYWDLVGISPQQASFPPRQLTVNALSDSGEGSLRRAIKQANSQPDFSPISIELAGEIKLNRDLPRIRSPLSLINTSLGNVVLQANGHRGLQLGTKAKGSTISGLWFAGAHGPGLSIRSRDASILSNRFGITPDGTPSTNSRQGLQVARAARGGSITAWQLNGFSRSAASQPSLTISGEQAELVTIRSDRVNVPLRVGFELLSGDNTPAQTTPLAPASSSGLGGQLGVSLGEGRWRPIAILPNGEQLKLTWLKLEGGSAVAEFTTSGAKIASSAQFAADTFRLNISLGSAGQSGTLQPGTLRMHVHGDVSSSQNLGFYPVSDPLTGTITTADGRSFNPSDKDYITAAIKLSKTNDWWLDETATHAAITTGQYSLPNFNPLESIAIVVQPVDQARSAFSSYPDFNSGEPARIVQSMEKANNAVFQIELSAGSNPLAFDYRDLQISLLGSPG